MWVILGVGKIRRCAAGHLFFVDSCFKADFALKLQISILSLEVFWGEIKAIRAM